MTALERTCQRAICPSSPIYKQLFLLLFLSLSTFSAFTQATLEIPEIQGDTLCGAGSAVLQASSIYDGQAGLMYNWYHEVGETIQLAKSLNLGIFITPELITSRTYYVSVSLNGLESLKVPIHAVIENTGSVLERPNIQLCDSVILHGSSTFDSNLLIDETYQWQRYVTQPNDEGYYVDINHPRARTDSIYITIPGFYRIVVTLPNGCKAISAGVEVTEEVIMNPTIEGTGSFCFGEANLPESVILTNDFARSFTKFQWEFSYDGITFKDTSRNNNLIIRNPEPEDYITYYVRLTLTEQYCSVSEIDTITFNRKPYVTATHKESPYNFFYCDTDPLEDRLLIASSTDSIIGWSSTQTLGSIEYMKFLTYFDPSTLPIDLQLSIGGDTLILNGNNWGLYMASAIDVRSGCKGLSNLIFAETAIPTIEGDTIICQNSPITLSAYQQSADLFSWTFSEDRNGTYEEISTEPSIELDPPNTTGAGYYKLTVVKNGCEETSQPYKVSSYPTPTTPELNISDTLICYGQSILLINTAPSTDNKVWYRVSGGLFDTAIGYSDSVEVSTSGSYYMMIDNDKCAAISNIIRIEVSPNIDTRLNIPNSPTCGPVLINLDSAKSNTEFYWWHYSTDGLLFDIISDSLEPHFYADKVGFYFVEIANTMGCYDTSAVVEVIGILEADIEMFTDSAKICGESSFAYLKVPLYPTNKYQWLYSIDSTSYSNAPGINNEVGYKAESEGYYKVVVDDGSCSEESTPVYVDIETIDNTSFKAKVIGEPMHCVIEDAYIASEYTSETAEFQWTIDNGTEQWTLDSLNSDTLFLSSAYTSSLMSSDSLSLTLTLEVYDKLCSSYSDAYEVIYYNNPALQITNSITGLPEDVVVCEDEVTLNVTNNTTLKRQYQWQKANDTGAFIDMNNSVDSTLSVEHAGTYRCLSFVESSFCQIESNTINVRFLPTTIFTTGQAYCFGDTLEMMADPGEESLEAISNYDYLWYSSADGQVFQEIAGENDVYVSLTSSSDSYTHSYFYFRALTENCEVTADTIELHTEFIPTYSIQTTNAACLGINSGSLFLEFVEFPAFTLTYTLDDTVSQNTPFFRNLAVGNHKLSISTAAGCIEEVDIVIESDAELSIQLDAEIEQYREVSFPVTASGAASYTWSPSDYVVNATDSIANFRVPQTHSADSLWIMAEGLSPEGCIAYARIGIHLNIVEEVIFPTIISPNDDGTNDGFEIIGLPDEITTELIIFDNWGNDIFSSKSYRGNSSESEKLNGLLRDLREGVYYYIFKAPDLSDKGSFYVKK